MINKTLLMSGAEYFGVVDLNAYSHAVEEVNQAEAIREFNNISAAVMAAGIKVKRTPAPYQCLDGIFTANWGLCRGDTVVLSNLPGPRKSEEAYAKQVLEGLGKRTIEAPLPFSGQGDALPCGNYLFAGSNYRTDPKMHAFVAAKLGYEVISLETVPEINEKSEPVINQLSKWPDSFFYDIDLAISVLKPDLIAWCPEAFMLPSQEKIRTLPLRKIEVTLEEAQKALACNLISTGETVIMNEGAPLLKARIENYGLKTITLHNPELAKGGGSIRCTTLTLDNV